METAPGPSPTRAEPKPRLRGVSHHVAFYFALLCLPVLVITASTGVGRTTSAIYGISLAALFGCSALLHRGRWSPQVEPWIRKLDHSTIFVFIAGTYTPVVAITAESRAPWMLAAVWSGAAIGVALGLFWIDAPRWLTSGVYLGVGWLALIILPDLWRGLGPGRFTLLALGGALFTAGAVVYARKRPDPSPAVFGYHEVFHALVIAGVALHLTLIGSLPR